MLWWIVFAITVLLFAVVLYARHRWLEGERCKARPLGMAMHSAAKKVAEDPSADMGDRVYFGLTWDWPR